MSRRPQKPAAESVAKMDKIVAISRQYGSGGRRIGQLVAERLGIPFYDKEIIQQAAGQSGIHASHFTEADQTGAGSPLYPLAPGVPFELPIQDRLYFAQRSAILALAAPGPCVMVGRGAGEVLKGRQSLLRVFIYAEIEARIQRALEEYQAPLEHIERRIKEIDKKRMAYYAFYEGASKQRTDHFDLCIDSGSLGIDGAVRVILSACR